MKTWIKDLNRRKFAYHGVHSQSYQDELLAVVFENIGTINAVPYCIEFGFNTPQLTEGSGANVAQLVMQDKWDCLLLDGEYENLSINLHRHFLTSKNICEIFQTYNVPKEPEYISIDVDSTDLWLFSSLLKEYRAMVYSVEYNANFPLNKAIKFPDVTDEHWEGDRAYGASLKALSMVAAEHGYSLLSVVPSLDAFFVRNDLINDGSNMLVAPYKKWANCTNIACHPPLKDKNRAHMFLDYEVFTSSNGDLEASRQAAYQTCMTYLVGNGDRLLRQARKIAGRPARKWRHLRGKFPGKAKSSIK